MKPGDIQTVMPGEKHSFTSVTGSYFLKKFQQLPHEGIPTMTILGSRKWIQWKEKLFCTSGNTHGLS